MADLATTFPQTPAFQAVSFRINTPSQISESFSGKIRRVGLGISYYSWDVKYSSLAAIDAGTITGYLSQALGQQFSFNIILPKISFSKAPNQTTNVPLAQAAARGSTSVSLTGCGASKNVLAAGDFFKFNNHGKVYMCVSPCVSNSSGAATLFFSCPSVTNIPSGTALTITAVPFQAILSEPEQLYDVTYGGITTMSISMREVWE